MNEYFTLVGMVLAHVHRHLPYCPIVINVKLKSTALFYTLLTFINSHSLSPPIQTLTPASMVSGGKIEMCIAFWWERNVWSFEDFTGN